MCRGNLKIFLLGEFISLSASLQRSRDCPFCSYKPNSALSQESVSGGSLQCELGARQ